MNDTIGITVLHRTMYEIFHSCGQVQRIEVNLDTTFVAENTAIHLLSNQSCQHFQLLMKIDFYFILFHRLNY